MNVSDVVPNNDQTTVKLQQEKINKQIKGDEKSRYVRLTGSTLSTSPVNDEPSQ